jgi:hypothetical protein
MIDVAIFLTKDESLHGVYPDIKDKIPRYARNDKQRVRNNNFKDFIHINCSI